MKKIIKLKTAGIMLMIIGTGIPVLTLIVTFPIYGLLYPSDQYLFTTGPIIILAFWLLPLIGGIYTLQRKRWRWAITGSVTALCYIVPFVLMLVDKIKVISQSSFLPMIILFSLLLFLSLLAIPATAFLILSRSEFRR
ncbi:MAG TPA: hypothetical protein G4O15_02875 [Dehalococcoidia bacterium]|nr:hypothetical protein [Dehalococcoidia bacterium]